MGRSNTVFQDGNSSFIFRVEELLGMPDRNGKLWERFAVTIKSLSGKIEEGFYLEPIEAEELALLLVGSAPHRMTFHHLYGEVERSLMISNIVKTIEIELEGKRSKDFLRFSILSRGERDGKAFFEMSPERADILGQKILRILRIYEEVKYRFIFGNRFEG